MGNQEGGRAVSGVITRLPENPGEGQAKNITPGLLTHRYDYPSMEEWTGEGRKENQALLPPVKRVQPLQGLESQVWRPWPRTLKHRSQGSITKDPVTISTHRGAGHLILGMGMLCQHFPVLAPL